MDQLQYFENVNDFVNINETLLFNKNNILNLYTRVGNLAMETIKIKRKHR